MHTNTSCQPYNRQTNPIEVLCAQQVGPCCCHPSFIHPQCHLRLRRVTAGALALGPQLLPPTEAGRHRHAQAQHTGQWYKTLWLWTPSHSQQVRLWLCALFVGFGMPLYHMCTEKMPHKFADTCWVNLSTWVNLSSCQNLNHASDEPGAPLCGCPFCLYHVLQVAAIFVLLTCSCK